MSKNLKDEINKKVITEYPDIQNILNSETFLIDKIFNMTPSKAVWYLNNSEDFEYFNLLRLFNIIQPIYTKFIETNDLYKKYPEYLV